MSTDAPRSNRRLWYAIIVLAIIAASTGSYAIVNVTSQRDHAVSRATVQTKAKKKAEATTQVVKDSGRDLADQVLAACAGTGKEAKALRAAALCGQATQTKTEITKAAPSIPGATGARGPGPTFAQVLEAVRQLIDGAVLNACGGSCNGTDGKDSTVAGPKGDTVTGPAGKDGKDGADSTVPGPVGPAGADGKDGRGITDATCSDDGRWTVLYTDGTTSDGGVCRVALIPDPTP